MEGSDDDESAVVIAEDDEVPEEPLVTGLQLPLFCKLFLRVESSVQEILSCIGTTSCH